MDVRSLSESSAVSYLSPGLQPSDLWPVALRVTIDRDLDKTQDPAGHSIPMMAVEACQPEALKYQLTPRRISPLEEII